MPTVHNDTAAQTSEPLTRTHQWASSGAVLNLPSLFSGKSATAHAQRDLWVVAQVDHLRGSTGGAAAPALLDRLQSGCVGHP